VVNYKVTVGLDKVDDVKPGMTANISILVASKDNAISVPLRAVLNKDGRKVVRVINDAKKKTFDEKEVTTGLEADGGVVEILSGLSEGQEVVTLIKQ
jgi:multidrug efflux pump subunit AcrA (membrane-fusion protein)